MVWIAIGAAGHASPQSMLESFPMDSGVFTPGHVRVRLLRPSHSTQPRSYERSVPQSLSFRSDRTLQLKMDSPPNSAATPEVYAAPVLDARSISGKSQWSATR